TTFFNARKDTINASPVFGVLVDYTKTIKISAKPLGFVDEMIQSIKDTLNLNFTYYNLKRPEKLRQP
ncbi:MAG: hypothetical protein L3J44_07170, partial [Campylobacteraceae bacterium]|nr:hypothetical protein [Campylobacteraceae bacterium]